MSHASFESLLGSSAGQSEMLDPREDVLRRKEQTKRTQRMIGTCKGKFTKEIKTFIQNAEYFLSKDTGHSVDDIDLPESGLMINCANAFLGSLDRVIDRYVELEKTLDDWKTFMTDVWEGTDEELITAISKQDEGFANYDKEYVDITRKYETVIERCKNISNKASQAQNVTETAPPSTNENRPTGAKPPGVFRPQADLKPIFLNKDCNLIEFVEFTKAYVLYMKSSGTTIPRDAVFSHLRVQVDAWWQHYIEHVGLTLNSDISHFIKIMDTAARNKFPVHGRRMKRGTQCHI